MRGKVLWKGSNNSHVAVGGGGGGEGWGRGGTHRSLDVLILEREAGALVSFSQLQDHTVSQTII